MDSDGKACSGAAGAASAEDAALGGTDELHELRDFRDVREGGLDLFQRVLHVEAAAERDVVHLVDGADVFLGITRALQRHLVETADSAVAAVVQPPYPVSSPSPTAFNLSQHQSLFQ